MKYVNCIIRCSSARSAFPADKTRIAQTSYINVVFFKVPFAPALPGLLADTINRTWLHNGILRRVFTGRGRAEYRDGAWPVDLADMFFFSKVQHVEQAFHIQLPCKHGVLFSCR